MTPDQIRARIAQLQNAIYSGVLTIQHGDTRTTFRSQDDLMAALRNLEAGLAEAEGHVRRRRGYYVTQSGKGY